MKNRHYITFIVFSSAFALLWWRTSTPTRVWNQINIANMTHQDLRNVGVYFGAKMAAGRGILVHGGLSTYAAITLPIPDKAEVRWEVNGVQHSSKVLLLDVIPPAPEDMNIWFFIQEDGDVTVKAVDGKDRAANQELGKKLRPFGDAERRGVQKMHPGDGPAN